MSETSKLEQRVAELEGTIRGLLACQEHLQSQLAWTPVSAGLPTEPGLYEFLKRKSNGLIEVFDMFELSPGHEFGDWGDVLSGEHFSSTEMPELEHTHYRRIELPEAL